jgi:UDP-N-acetyl-alpha-D-muramoyl-L-alanyl-L-glutamate epimerase
MAFDPTAYTTFSYREYRFRATRFEATFHYRLSGETAAALDFTEKVQFTPGLAERVDTARLEGLLVLLGAVLGLSYYKLAAPDEYVIEQPGLTREAQEYLALLISEGMAEFAYRNGFQGPLQPTITHPSSRDASAWPEASWRAQHGDPIVPIGGGKDSVVSVELLHRHRLHPIQFAVNANPTIRRVARASGHPLVTAQRTIDPRLLELNTEGGLNGHVPVTAMNSLIALCQSRILDGGPVVMSNESSASDSTLEVDGWSINHQWSKSWEAEQALQAVIGPQAGLSPEHYFSLLRPFSELRIAGAYANYSQYHRVATSCNRAYRMDAGDVSWCGECDKCRFVYLVLSAYLSPQALRGIFGRDLLNESQQIPGYEELLGLARHKPFECVGTEAESLVALSVAARRQDWSQHSVVAHFEQVIPGLSDVHDELEYRVWNPSDDCGPLPADYVEAQGALR